ncbi:MAG: diguanylate cyclase, partial [Clostridia bacterium]|nr:diguanylate cyclase [Clostridia bacterium]
MTNQNTPENIFERVLTTLYDSADTAAALGAVLPVMGEHCGVGRVYIMEDMEDGSWFKNTFEWCAEGVAPRNTILSRVCYDDIGGKELFYKSFDKDGIFFCRTGDEIPESVRRIFSPEGVQTSLVCAIIENGEYCGCIGCEEYHDKRVWTPDQIKMLSMVSKLIGAFLLKIRRDDSAALSEDFQSALDNSASFIYLTDPETYEVLYSNRAIREYFGSDYVGCTCHRQFLGLDKPCPGCPISAYRSGGKPVATEIRRPDGMWVLTQASPLHWHGRDIMMVSCTDITAHKITSELLRQRGEEYAIVVEQSGKKVLRYDIKTRRAECYFEPTIVTGFGRTIDDYPNKVADSPLADPSRRQDCFEYFRLMERGIPRGSANLKFLQTDGSHIWIHSDYTLVNNGDGSPSHAIVSFYDNTAQYEKQLAYDQWEARFAELSKNAIYIELSLSKNLVERQVGLFSGAGYVNMSFTDFLRHSLAKVIHPEDAATYTEFFSSERLLALFSSGVTNDSVEYRTTDISAEPTWFRADLSLAKSPTTDDIKAFVIFTNIDCDRREMERLSRLASIDSLTGVFNRETVYNKVSALLSEAMPEDVSALFMIDLDNFKQVNDLLGHQAGDELLKNASAALTDVFRDDDVVGRVGGDEFMAFLPNVSDSAVIRERADKILEALMFSVGSLSLTASVGVAVCRGPGKTFNQLYAEADMALYHAKTQGKHCYYISSGDILSPSDVGELSSSVQLKSLLEYMDGGVVLAEISGGVVKIIYASPSFIKSLSGIYKDIGSNYENLFSQIYSEDQPAIIDALIKTAETGEIFDISYRAGEDGLFWHRLHTAKIPLNNDEKAHVIGIVTDLTEIKRAEESLHVAKESYRIAMSQTGSLIWEVDIPARTMRQAPEVSAVFGSQLTEFPDAPASFLKTGLIHPDSESEFIRMFDDIYAGREGKEYTVLAKNENEGYVWVHASFRLIRDGSGEPALAIGVVDRISNSYADMRFFEQELQFASSIESNIVGFIRANLNKKVIDHLYFPGLSSRGIEISSYDELYDVFVKYLPDVGDHAKLRMLLNIESLFKSYRLNENWKFSEFRRTAADGQIRWTNSSLSLLRQPSSGDLYLFLYIRDIDDCKEWEASMDGPVTRDPVTMLYSRDTFRGLVNSALKLNADRDGMCAITCIEIGGLEKLRSESGVKAVNDLLFSIGRFLRTLVTGEIIIGRMTDTRLAVFRADTDSISRQQSRAENFREQALRVLRQTHPYANIEMCCGFSVERFSEAKFDVLYGKASLACLTAKQWNSNPVVAYSEQSVLQTGDVSLSPEETGEAGRKTILVADDDIVARMIMRGVLEPHYDVVDAENGAQALDLLRTNKDISLVFLDIVMPVMDGWAVLDAMQSEKELAGIPVIVVTADGDTDNVVKALDRGASDVIAKPYQPIIVTSRTRNTLSRNEAVRIASQNRSYEMRIQRQAAMLRAAERDELTGMFNKHAFYRRVRERITSSPAECFVMLSFDIDRFKIFNDLFGTAAGDKLLRDIGASIASLASEDLIFSRLESDHFACFAKAALVDAAVISMFISGWLNDYTSLYKLTISIGAYLVDDLGLDVSLMCDRALLAERTVKNSYTDKFAFYDSKMWETMLDEQRLAADIDHGIESGQIFPFYQPQYNQVTGELVGAEALARWMHTEQGLISPSVFIPVFENNGLITKLDVYLWEKVCVYIRRRLDEGKKVVPISVNISRKDFFRLNLVEHLSSLVAKYGLSPDMLRLEITESAYMDDPDQLIGITNALQAAGFFIEMDDFGSGYSSLNTLKNVPVNLLKLDMRFLEKGVGEGRRSGIILNSIISMANWLNLPVLAEGVETARQAEYLRTLGCSLVQGFLFSKPLSETDFTDLLDISAMGDIKKFSIIADFFDTNEFWDPDSQATVIFNSFVGAAGIFEYYNGTLTAMRVNDEFFKVANVTRAHLDRESSRLLNTIHPDDRKFFVEGVEKALQTKDFVETDARWEHWDNPGEYLWLHFRIRKVGSTLNRFLLYVGIDNITSRKLIEERMRFQAKLLETENERSRILLDHMGIATVDYDICRDLFVLVVKKLDGQHHISIFENYLHELESITSVHPDYVSKY